ncbi:unnamed protein product [Darwinula stevensoni]|uniref:Sema domain-containing protein n=1 Tax=Darwinula stevensoni TaxID=69355 RepID=A0A7R9FT88_9CRUS|nr:unnamed protein product [Darwinula stevensoni]CAG0905426.1 unnamed protein product [Darwinula stevensoni]
MHSRVGRVLKDDKGGPRSHSRRWTSFSKATLDCEIPGDSPFQFTEIQSTTRRIRKNGKDMVYAVFATNRNSLAASAICAYSFDDIRKAFNGPFMGKYSPKSEWIKVSDYEVPNPRPGSTLVKESRQISEAAVNFIMMYPFMYDHVQPIYQQPIFVFSQDKNNARLSRIVVDEDITGVDGSTHDVIFMGTDDGRVLKVIYNEDDAAEKVNAVVLEDLEVLGNAKRVVNMYRYREEGKPAKIVVIGDEQIKALPVHRCNLVKSCRDCVKLQDPYCAWDTMGKDHCFNVDSGSYENKHSCYVQDVRSGKSSLCPQLISHLGDEDGSNGTMLSGISGDSLQANGLQRYPTVPFRRFSRFIYGETSVKDKAHSRGHITATTDKKIRKVEER